MAKGVIQQLRRQGVKVGLFRPITLWPFPVRDLRPLLERIRRLIVVEASNGQLEDELRLSMSHAGIREFPEIEHVRRYGGMLPEADEIVDIVNAGEEVSV